MLSTGVGPLCFIKSRVNTAVYQDILEHFMLPSANKLYGEANFIFQQELEPARTAKSTKTWFNDHEVTALDWPANIAKRQTTEVRREQCRGAEGRY